MKLSLILLLASVMLPATSCEGQTQDNSLSGDEFLIFKWVNQERAQNNLPALRWDDHLRDSARKHSALMAELDQMSHDLPGEPSLMQRIAATGLRMDRVAENVAYAESALDIWESWMRSPPHRENILNPKVNAIGVGLARRGSRIYATQNFARVIEESSSKEAAGDLGKAFNDLRKQFGMSAVPVTSDPGRNRAACDMAKSDKLSPNAVPRQRGTSHYVVFTAADPANLPQQLVSAAHLPNIQELLIGSCFMATKNYPGGIFWISAAY